MEAKLDDDGLDTQTLPCLARLPTLMQQAKVALGNEDHPAVSLVACMLEGLRQHHQHTMLGLRQRLDLEDLGKLATPWCSHPLSSLLYALYSRSYAFSLVAGIALSCLLRRLRGPSSELEQQSVQMALETLDLARHASKYRPLGSMYMLLCLSYAWIATDDHTIQKEAERLLNEYIDDLVGAQANHVDKRLQLLKRRFKLV